MTDKILYHKANKQSAVNENIENEESKTSGQGLQPVIVDCPSFENEPWKSRAEAVRPKELDYYLLDDSQKSLVAAPLPVSTGHPYLKLILEFLDSVPKECWIDEENEED